MSSPTWTPDALRSEVRPFRGDAWRMVEAQHAVSTQKICDSLAEQAVLEEILDEVKPPVPEACRHLDYLLYTPFRHRPYPYGSRFRRAGLTPGVWYGAAAVEVAVAEMCFYRLLFYAESPATPFPDNAADYTAFAAALATPAALDLTQPPLDADTDSWTDPVRYEACQALADTARAAGAELIAYRSVRDPEGGRNLALLTCAGFARPRPVRVQSWRIRIGASGIVAMRDHPRLWIEYPRETFTADPRLSDMVWDRTRR
ncbi:RES family NAD+ phosphorylase [Oceanomicrobium pacificus]|uniref:RES domain-containing protein n=1 Tax=Oceanomicrobium pacificus TaxID=2692916 RepID=A0A6B0TM54_9RHOB|nr:RES family NAD+ phosphorylase [Oceanomicrobium pacificus]MXU65640.1 RES domain-containing protein [Oceanomicrobium pacificus]